VDAAVKPSALVLAFVKALAYLAPKMPLTPGPPGPPGLGGRRCSTHIPIASPSSFQSCQVELAKKGGQKRGHAVFFLKKLDDGWPESVEEQGLLLLVWRRNIRNGI